jgi:hypothetical protein
MGIDQKRRSLPSPAALSGRLVFVSHLAASLASPRLRGPSIAARVFIRLDRLAKAQLEQFADR